MNTELIDLGLTPFFTRQLTPEEAESCAIVRVVEVQCSRIVAGDGKNNLTITPAGNYRKLLIEDARNSASVAELRHRDKQFGKTIKAHLALKRTRETRQ